MYCVQADLDNANWQLAALNHQFFLFLFPNRSYCFHRDHGPGSQCDWCLTPLSRMHLRSVDELMGHFQMTFIWLRTIKLVGALWLRRRLSLSRNSKPWRHFFRRKKIGGKIVPRGFPEAGSELWWTFCASVMKPTLTLKTFNQATRIASHNLQQMIGPKLWLSGGALASR